MEVTAPSVAQADVHPTAGGQEPRETGGGFWSAVKRIGPFLWWIITGFGLIPTLLGHNARRNDEIVTYSVHRSFFLWAIILAGFVGAGWVHVYPGSSLVWGWIYLFVLLYTFVTLLFDVSTPKALIWGGIVLLIWISSRYLEEHLHRLMFLTAVFRFLRSLHPELNPGFALVMSLMLFVPWIGSLFHSFCRGRTIFSPNTIEEWHLGIGSEITDRSGMKFRSHYRDWLETILGLGAGDIEAVDPNHNVVKRWENIVFLVFTWKKLDQVFHQRAATVDNAPEDPVEVEEIKRPAAKVE
ncbi:MAG TPA: hypothetical protein VL282_06655 [Tepidisphaeraceae bacterium]|nr:hypothetical protein [Tepidisphaeraceae bacterium]